MRPLLLSFHGPSHSTLLCWKSHGKSYGSYKMDIFWDFLKRGSLKMDGWQWKIWKSNGWFKGSRSPILGELRVHSGSNPWWVYYGYIMSTLWVPHGYSHMGILWTDRITMWFHLVCSSSKHIVEYSLWVHCLRVIEQQWFLIIYHNFRSPLKLIHIFQSPSRGYVKPIYRL
jgi:hypothetical protein